MLFRKLTVEPRRELILFKARRLDRDHFDERVVSLQSPRSDGRKRTVLKTARAALIDDAERAESARLQTRQNEAARHRILQIENAPGDIGNVGGGQAVCARAVVELVKSRRDCRLRAVRSERAQ